MNRLIVSLIIGAVGVASTLAGLAVDAWLHAHDATLASREGIFTLGNPGHLLLGLGVAMTCGGLIAGLHIAWGMADVQGLLGRPWVRLLSMRMSSLAAAGAVIFAVGVSAQGHDEHTDATTHSHPADAAIVDLAAVSSGDLPHPHTDLAADALQPAAPAADGAPESITDPAAHEHSQDAPAPAPASLVTSEPPVHAHDAAHEEVVTAPVAAEPAAQPVSDGPHDHAAPPASASQDEAACGAAFVAEVRAATARFEDFDVAVAEGYVKNTPGAAVAHYHNKAYVRDGNVLDAAHPEDLMYVKTATGMHLAGVMFLAKAGEPGPLPCGTAYSWHTHDNVCFNASTGAVVGILDADGKCPAGSILFVPPEMLHVWLADVPGGPFAHSMDPRELLKLFA